MRLETLVIHDCGGNPRNISTPTVILSEEKMLICESFYPKKNCLDIIPMTMKKVATKPSKPSKKEATCQNTSCRFYNPNTDVDLITIRLNIARQKRE